MNILDIIKNLSNLDVYVFAEDGKLKTRSAKDALTPEVVQLIKNNKDELLEYLTRESNSANKTQQVIMRQEAEHSSLSFAQQRLWLLDKIDGGSVHYHLPEVLKLTGPVDLVAMEKAFVTIVERHESIRTNFVEDAQGNPIPVLRTSEQFRVPLVDLTDLDTESQKVDVEQRIEEEVHKDFDLSKDYILRAQLLKLNQNVHMMLVTMHHIASDDWSMGLLINELNSLYSAYLKGQQNPLPALAIQYSDYAHWQRSWLKDNVLDEQLEYWKKQLANLPSVHGLPLDNPRPAIQTFDGEIFNDALDVSVCKAFSKTCQAQGATLFMGLQAAFSVLMARYSNETDIVMGTSIANREQEEVAPLIGFFMNNLVLRSDLSTNPEFASLLQQSKTMLLEAYAHQQVSFEQIVETLQPERNLSHSPLFQVMLVLHNTEDAALELPGLKLETMERDKAISKYDLILNMTEQDDGLELSWEYNCHLFKKSSIERMSHHFAGLIKVLTKQPELNVFSIPMLDAEEQTKQCEKWNATAQSYCKDLCIGAQFEVQVVKTPDAIAVEYQDGALTYEQLNQKANRLADYFLETGLEAGDRVGIYLNRSVEMMVAVLGVMKAGGAYVPLEPEHPIERIQFILQDAEVEQVLISPELLSRTSLKDVDVMVMEDVAQDDSWLEEFSDENPEEDNAEIHPESPLYVLYTSGSTGKPKGVMVPHRGVSNYLHHAVTEYMDEKIQGSVVSSPLCFDATLTTLLTPLVAGKTVRLLPDSTETLALLHKALFEANDAWLFKITPAHLEALANMSTDEQLCSVPHKIVVGGEQLSWQTLSRYRSDWLPATTFINEYGPTETVVGCSIYTVEPESNLSALAAEGRGAVPIGRPICNTRLYVMSPGLQAQPINSIGELYIAGDGVSLGYLNRAELQNERFVCHPDNAQELLYRTGDLVRWLPQGQLEFVGRVDHQVKLRGYRIELGEIENALTSQERISEAVAKVYEDDTGKRLVAYVVPTQSPQIDDQDKLTQHNRELSQELIAGLKRVLPEYQVPSVCVVLASLPLTANGKVDLKALPTPQEGGAQVQKYVAPTNATETLLCDIWQQVLKLEKVGIKDNFFSIGGDSILSIRIVFLLKEQGVFISIQDIFRFQNIELLAQFIAENSTSEQMEPAQIQEPFELLTDKERELLADKYQDAYPMSFLQAGMVFHTQKEGFNGIYHDINAEHIKCPWDQELFTKAMAICIDRHPVLRTGFYLQGDRPLQVVHHKGQIPLVVGDLRELSFEQQEARLEQWMSQRLTHQFDWLNGPLFQVDIFLRDELSFEFIISFHHAVLDGWSRASFNRELYQTYRELLSGETVSEGEVDWTYRDYIALERRALDSADAKSFFVQQLDNIGVEQIPVTHRAKATTNDTANYQVHEVQGLEQLSPKVIAMARQLGVPVQAILYTAHLKVLSLISGSNSPVSCMVTNGRPEQSGGDQGLGLYLNSIPLSITVQEESWQSLIQRVSQHLANSTAYRHYPLAQIQQDMGAEFSEVNFNYTHFHVLDSLVQEGDGGVEALGSKGVEHTNFNFTLDISRKLNEAEFSMFFNYNADLYDPDLIAKMAQYYQRAIRLMVESPDASCIESPILLDSELQAMQVWNETAVEFPAEKLVHQLFEEQVAKHQNNTALVFANTQISYGELNREANQLAHYLMSQRGIQVGDRVGICMERSITMVRAILAILKAGAAYVPLDPNHPEARLRYTCDSAGISLLLTDSQSQAVIESLDYQYLDLDDTRLLQELNAFSGENLRGPDITSVNNAYVLYTSGSTGKPKGVMVPHKGIVNYLEHARKQYLNGAVEGSVVSSPLSFDATVTSLFTPLCGGKKVILLPDSTQVLSALNDYLFSDTPLLFKISPAHLQALSHQHNEAISSAAGHCIVIGGEQLTVDTVKKWKSQLLPEATFVNEYGPTETVVGCSTYFIRELADLEHCRQSVVIGKPIQNTQLYVLNDNQPAPLGTPGELFIGGAGVTNGYIQQEALTQERFIVREHNGLSESLYKTGDLVRWDHNGELEFIRRIDDQIKIRGFRIEPGEIEALLGSLTEVDSCLVSVVERAAGQHQLVAHIKPTSDAEKTDKAQLAGILKQSLNTQLPHYMVPDSFVLLDEWPLTVNGKIDKKALPIPGSSDSADHHVAAGSAVEQSLVDIWCEVLQLETISVNDNFFELGGNSILCFRIQSLIKERINTDVQLTDIFEFPTISSLAQHLSGSQQESQRRVLAEEREVESDPSADIAVIGMSGRFPGAANVEEFWQNIREGVESIQFFDDQQLLDAGVEPELISDPNYVKSGYVLEGMEEFDARYYAYTPREVEILDPQQRLMLECATEAMEHAGYGDQSGLRDVGVFVGVSESMYAVNNLLSHPHVLADAGRAGVHANSPAFAATRIAYKLNLAGPGINVLTACSTSLVTVHQACNSLRLNECEMALAGGAGISLLQSQGYLYEEGGIDSPDGHCRPFDKNSQGTRSGSGAGMLLLKRLDKAITDKDTIHAVIKGTAINNDAMEKVGFTAPSIAGQEDVIRRALQDANVEADSIEFVETHGTGTKIGDPIEIKALHKAYGSRQNGHCALGAVKANIGHLDSAAGIAGIIKTIQALKHQEIPPQVNFSESNEQIDFEQTPFYINSELQSWSTSKDVRRAGVSSFGIGGTNAHVILEEAPTKAATQNGRSSWMLPLSAKSPSALQAARQNLRKFLEATPNANLNDVEYTLQLGRHPHEFRTPLACHSVAEAIAELSDNGKVMRSRNDGASVIFMFPGQGAQYLEMARQLYQSEEVFRDFFNEGAKLFKKFTGEDLVELIYGDSDKAERGLRLNFTQFTQPALFVIEYALARLLMNWGIKPDAMTGHSIGEYVAACLAGVFTLEDAIKLVCSRGQLMSQADTGAMLSVASSESLLTPLLAQTGTCLAAVNAASQCVASGACESIAELKLLLDEQNIAYRDLHTSHAFHSDMMETILPAYLEVVKEVRFNAPKLPYVSNVTGDYIKPEQVSDPQYWLDHLRGTVCFAQGIDNLLSDSTALKEQKVFVEVGPGINLSSLVRKHATAREHVIVSTVRHPNDSICDILNLQRALGTIWGSGVRIDWQAYHKGQKAHRIPLPTYPFERQRYWIDVQPQSNTGPVQKAGKLAPENWFYQPVWKQQPKKMGTTAELTSLSESWLLLMDEMGLGDTLARRLREAGHKVVCAYHGEQFALRADGNYDFDMTREDAYVALFRAVSASTELTRVVHLASIAPVDQSSTKLADVFWAEQERGLLSGLYSAKAIVKAQFNGAMQIDFITANSLYVTGEELVEPARNTLSGLCKVAPQEYPEWSFNQIDILLNHPLNTRSLERFANQILGEFYSDERSVLTAIRGQHCWIQEYQSVSVGSRQTAAHKLDDNGVYVITGGLGKIGLLLANYISKTVQQPRIALLARSSFPHKQHWDSILENRSDIAVCRKIEQIKAIQNRGAKVEIIAADAGDLQQMQVAFEHIESQFGEINGVIHCAGQIHGSMTALSETGRKELEQQYRSKVDGVMALDKLLSTRNVDFCMLMSSLSSVLGGLGFTAYSAGNLFMDAFVQRKHIEEQTHWFAVNWDGWDFPDLHGSEAGAESLDASLSYAMTPEEGELAFARALSDSWGPQQIHSTGCLELRFEQWVDKLDVDDIEQTLYERPELETDYLAPANESEEQLVAIWQNILGIEQIGTADNFFELGGDSLVATRVLSEIRQTFAIDDSRYSIRDFFEAPVIKDMAPRIRAGQTDTRVEDAKQQLVDEGKVVEEGFF